MFITVFLLFISVCSTITNNAVMNGVSKRSFKSGGDMLLFNFFAYAVCLVIFCTMAVVERSFSFFSVWFGILFGVMTACNTLCNMMALRNGPMHITLLVTTSSMLIPTFYDVIFNGSTFNIFQFIATVALILFIYLATTGKNSNKEKTAVPAAKVNVRWLIFCALAFVTGGLIGVMQKIHGAVMTSMYSDVLGEDAAGAEMSLFLASAFVASTFFSLLSSRGQKRQAQFGHKLILLAILSGVCIFTMNYLNLKYANVLPSALFFPVINGSMVIASSVVAVTLFKEPLNKRQFIGMAGGLAALIAICMLQK